MCAGGLLPLICSPSRERPTKHADSMPTFIDMGRAWNMDATETCIASVDCADRMD